jgi:glycosyltransferase involved in cell wall biosynthesis
MKIVFFAQQMPDPCGAFFHDIAIAKELQRRGHGVHFVTTRRAGQPIRGVYRGISWTFYTNAENELKGASVWSSPHYPFLKLVRKLNERFEKPLVVTMHFGENLDTIVPYSREGNWAEFLWIVSRHLTEETKARISISPTFKTIESVRPIMLENEIKMHERGTLPTGQYITLINANLMKGLGLFIECAVKFPDRKFLGVRPYYNGVKVPENIPNIKWIDIQDDIRNILKDTRILLVPSLYESWGRVAFEAMYNGIPVLHTKPMARDSPHARPSGSTEGMCEWIETSQFMLDYGDLSSWFNTIESLDDPVTYKEYSDRAYETTYNMNCFQDIQDIIRKFNEYGVQFAPKQPENKGVVVSTPSSVPAIPARGNAMPFRGGRFVVRK